MRPSGGSRRSTTPCRVEAAALRRETVARSPPAPRPRRDHPTRSSRRWWSRQRLRRQPPAIPPQHVTRSSRSRHPRRRPSLSPRTHPDQRHPGACCRRPGRPRRRLSRVSRHDRRPCRVASGLRSPAWALQQRRDRFGQTRKRQLVRRDATPAHSHLHAIVTTPRGPVRSRTGNVKSRACPVDLELPFSNRGRGGRAPELAFVRRDPDREPGRRSPRALSSAPVHDQLKRLPGAPRILLERVLVVARGLDAEGWTTRRPGRRGARWSPNRSGGRDCPSRQLVAIDHARRTPGSRPAAARHARDGARRQRDLHAAHLPERCGEAPRRLDRRTRSPPRL